MRATYFSCKTVKFDVLRGCWRFCIRISWFCSLIFYCARRVCSHFWSKISDYRNHKCYSWVSQDPLESLILLCIKLMMLKSKYWCLLLWPMFPLLCGFKKKKIIIIILKINTAFISWVLKPNGVVWIFAQIKAWWGFKHQICVVGDIFLEFFRPILLAYHSFEARIKAG